MNDDKIIADLQRQLYKQSILLQRYITMFWNLKDAIHLNSISAANFQNIPPDQIEVRQIPKKDYDSYMKIKEVIRAFDISLPL